MRKRFLVLILLSLPLGSFSQDINFELDFSAVYWAPKSNDTIRISVGNNGRYIFTDSEEVAKSFGSITRRFQPAGGKENADLKLLFDLKTIFMLMEVKIGQNTVLANVDLNQFMKKGKSIDSATVRKMSATPTALKIENNGKKYKLYGVAPDNKPDDLIYMAFNEKYPVDYDTYFSKLMTSATGELFSIDIPSGLLVHVEDSKGEIILELLSIKKKKQKGSANIQLKLE
ncbi:hypothetical protein [Flagellimonas meridianipacifica]|uniref:GLPGLI family protein n=1 Tax=Flagellimonas meridianipacifica TaxID=1080225 RepID=A0A2T0M6Y4_9FLAO|nr:hypothetical protein [Allomuricauda pacifica]PRX53226.1 hypothetical protein CLV81_4135 [Allomuricauda pacifica]